MNIRTGGWKSWGKISNRGYNTGFFLGNPGLDGQRVGEESGIHSRLQVCWSVW